MYKRMRELFYRSAFVSPVSADRAFFVLYACMIHGSVCIGLPFKGMLLFGAADNGTASCDFTFVPVAGVITATVVNMGMFQSAVFFAPVIVPFDAHDTDSVIAACRHAVCFTAFLAQLAVRTDRSAIRANLTALRADLRAVLAGVTSIA